MNPGRSLRVGILGFGTVGSGVYRMLAENGAEIARKIGMPVEVVAIGIRDATKPRPLGQGLFTTDLETITDHPDVDVVLELIGGVEPAGTLVERALRNGKSVVTANKELLAKHGSRLVNLAKAHRLDLHYEAAVGGGIPLIQPLKHQLAGNDVLRMVGILNGTTNYILTDMQEGGVAFEDSLADAQRKGYAEADPTSDVDGFDTAYKTAILASIAFGRQVPIESVYREGIRRVTAEDIAQGEKLGYRIKLTGIVEPVGERVRVRVHPSLVPLDHPLAGVRGVYNALYLHGDYVGDVMFSGRGAGSDPTASAVVGDLMDVGRNLMISGPGSALPYGEDMPTASMDDLRSRYYLRMRVQDRPGVLALIAATLGEAGVSISAMEMKTLSAHEAGEIVMLTDECEERAFFGAVGRLGGEQGVSEVQSTIRVL